MPSDSKERAELTGSPKPELTASGALSLGDRVSLISGGNGQASGSSNSEKWIGFPAASISNGASGEINVLGYIASGFSGLTVNATYYVASDGTISTTQRENFRVGRAVSSTEILVEEGLVGSAPAYGASGGDVMFGAGKDTVDQAVVDTKLFSSTATAVSHGNLSQARYELSAASDGTQVMFGGGGSTGPAFHNTCDMVQFASNTTATDHGDLSVSRRLLAAASDGTQVMFAGGYTFSAFNTCDMKQFASTSIAIDHGDLSVSRGYLAAGSDGAQVMFGGGNTGSYVNTCDMKQFASTSIAVDHGDLSLSRGVMGAGSDGAQVMFTGGNTGSTGNPTCDMKQFASTSIAVDHGDLTGNIYQHAAGSDGTQLMIGGGYTTGSVLTCEMKQFSTTVIAVNHGNLSHARWGLAGASGN